MTKFDVLHTDGTISRYDAVGTDVVASTRLRPVSRTRMRKDFDESKHPRVPAGQPGGGEFGDTGATTDVSPSRSTIAKAHAVPVGERIQRYSEEHNEPVFAKAVGGVALKDNEPVDVVMTSHGIVTGGCELKTMVSNTNDKITMNASAIDRKAAWVRENRADFHTVVFDDRRAFDARGVDKHDPSQRDIYYRRGFGSFRLSNMYKVSSLTELRKLMTTKTRDLPESAKPPAGYPKFRVRKQLVYADTFFEDITPVGAITLDAGGVAFDEGKHPRDAQGRWAVSDAGGATSDAPSHEGHTPFDQGDQKRAATNAEWVASLTPREQDAATHWAGQGYRYMRWVDRGKADQIPSELRDRAVERLAILRESLRTAPLYSGAVYRGLATTEKDIHTTFAVGNTTRLEAVSSFSTSPVTAKDFAKDNYVDVGPHGEAAKVPLIMRVETTRGVALGGATTSGKTEQEVLIDKGAKFSVKDLRPVRDKADKLVGYQVVLTEIN